MCNENISYLCWWSWHEWFIYVKYANIHNYMYVLHWSTFTKELRNP